MLDFMYVKYIVHYEWVLLLIYCGAEMHPCDPYIYMAKSQAEYYGWTLWGWVEPKIIPLADTYATYIQFYALLYRYTL